MRKKTSVRGEGRKGQGFHARFGVRRTPLTREISVDEQFVVEGHEEVVDAIVHAIEERGSVGLLARSGAGKTQLVRRVVDRLPPAHHRVTYVKVTGVSKRDLCRHISAAIGVEPAGNYPTLVERLQAKWTRLADVESLHPVLILDDAHEMRPDVLGLVRVLTNFEMDSRLCVSIFLVGQRKLATLLARDELEDVARRLTHIATLDSLSREESHRYLEHRLTIAGAKRFPFDPRAVEMVYDVARGNLRATDQLALKCLEVAHRGDSDTVSPNHVMKARTLVCP